MSRPELRDRHHGTFAEGEAAGRYHDVTRRGLADELQSAMRQSDLTELV